MGLQVVNDLDELPISLQQSWLRNLTLTAPMLLLELDSLLPTAWQPHIVTEVCNISAAIYAVIVFPLESYRAYNREDGLRLGDLLAHTRLTEAATDFDNFLSNRKN